MIHLGHEDRESERDDEKAANVDCDRHDYLAGSTVLDAEGREWVQQDADDREEGKAYRRTRRYLRGRVER